MDNNFATIPATTPLTVEPQDTTPPETMARAYQLVADEIAAVPEDKLVPLNLEIVSTVFTARGAVPEIRKLRPDMVGLLSAAELASVDKIDTYATALLQTQASYRMAATAVEQLPAIVERATALRDTFVADATALARRGYLDKNIIEARPRGPGFKNLVAELGALITELRRSWPKINARSGIQYGEFDEADALIVRIAQLVGLREQAPSTVATEAALERLKAFTLLIRAYERARKAVTFLRWDHGDADTLVPSLYAGRGNGGRRKSELSNAKDDANANDASAPAAGTEPSASATSPAGSVATPNTPAIPALAKGFPGSDPFGPG